MHVFFSLFLLFASSVSAQAADDFPCAADAARVAPSISVEILKKSRYLQLDSVFGELAPACQYFLIKEFAQTEPCLQQALQLCPGKDVNKANRRRCLERHLQDIPLTCVERTWSECAATLKRSCPPAAGASCFAGAYKTLSPICQKLFRNSYPWETECTTADVQRCFDVPPANEGRLKCIRKLGKNLTPTCRKAIVQNVEFKSDCFEEVLTLCDGADVIPQNWGNCYTKHRAKLSKTCLKEVDTYFLYVNCVEPTIPKCKERRGDDLVNCIHSQKIELNAVCKTELANRGLR